MNYLTMNEKNVKPLVHDMNILLAAYTVYYQKLRSFHWNVLGKNFFDLHTKFEELYTDARVKIDAIAERVLTLRYHPISTYKEYLSLSPIEEVSPFISDTQMVNSILKDHGILLSLMKTIIDKADTANDEGTIDMIGGYISELEKISWMLDAWNMDTKDQLKTSEFEILS